MDLQKESTYSKPNTHRLQFINQRAPWKLAIAILGVVIIASSFFIYKGFKGNWLYALGMILLFIPQLFPLCFKNYVRYQNNFFAVKLNRDRVKRFKPSSIKYIEVFSDKIYIWKTRKKRDVLCIAPYSSKEVNMLVNLLKGEMTSLVKN